MTAVTAADILRRARAWIEDPARWTQKNWAIRADRSACASTSPDAVAWCAVGALNAATSAWAWEPAPSPAVLERLRALDRTERAARDALKQALGGGAESINDLMVFNDDPATTHADMLALFDRAIALAEAEDGGAR